MNNSPKLLLVVALALSSVQMPMLANDPIIDQSTPVSVPNSNSPQPYPQIIQINQNKPRKDKRHVSILRMLWNIAIKSHLGASFLVGGLALLPYSLGAFSYGVIKGHPEILMGSSLGLVISLPLAYGGYALLQNSLDSIRDEFVESYFGISNPDQI